MAKGLNRQGVIHLWDKIKAKFVAKEAGKGLSTNDYTTAEKTKLANLNNYTHPTHGAKSNGLYKITVDAQGHVSNATDITKTDITNLGIPAQDTTYSNVTTSLDGLMSKSDKVKLDGIDEGANKYTHPSSHPATMITEDATHKFVTDSQISVWDAKSNFSGSYTDLTNKPTLGSLAAKSTVAKADLATDVQTSLGKADTALQSFTETDPTVPAWAKTSSKPSYTAGEVGAVPTSRKVNGKTLSDDVTIVAADISDVYSATEVDNKVSSSISTHNSATDAHSDIRTTLAAVKEDVDTFFKDATISTEAKDTLKEIQDYITSDVSAAAEMTASINNKVDKISGKGLSTNDLTDTLKSNYDTAYSHVSNKSNPHGVTLSTLGVSATATELNYVDGVTSNIQTQLDNKASNTHTHPYVSSMVVDGSTFTYNKGDGTTESFTLPSGGVSSWNDLQDKPFDDTTLVYKNSAMEMRKYIDDDGVSELYMFRAEHFSLEYGKTYTVIIDGVQYEAVHGAIGTDSTLGDWDNQGFEVIETTTICTILTKIQATSIEIIKQEVKQIDTKYLPEVTWNDLSDKPFCDNVQVYENDSMIMNKWTTEDDTEAIYVFEVSHFEFELELGKSYTVILDGVEHSVICNANGSNKIIGDTSVQGFRIIDYGNTQDIIIITLQPATSIKVIKNEVQQLDTKYIQNASTINDGLMSSTDKSNFDTLYASAYTNLTTTDANALVKEVFG